MTAKTPDATPELLDDYIKAVCESAPGEARRMAVRGITGPPPDGIVFTYKGEDMQTERHPDRPRGSQAAKPS